MPGITRGTCAHAHFECHFGAHKAVVADVHLGEILPAFEPPLYEIKQEHDLLPRSMAPTKMKR